MESLFSKRNLDVIGAIWFATFMFFILVGFNPAVMTSPSIISEISDTNFDFSRVKVITPPTAPKPSQESIDIALKLFSIDVPSNAEHPTFESELKDRGHTIRSVFSDKAVVRIGPSAFESWGILGSTLAHEIEVHCRQQFGSIYALDLVGLNGTKTAEVEAYNYELANAMRFNLTMEEIKYISSNRDYYLFDKTTTRIARFLDIQSKFFAKMFSK